MAIDRFMIAPLTGGLQTSVKPWLIPDEAFEQLNNAYVFRGRVRKRFGSRPINGFPPYATYQLNNRLRIKVGTTAAVTGNFPATVMPGIKWEIGQMFSVGSTMFTVVIANGATLTTGTATATYNTATGSLVITGNNTNPLTDVYFYPTQPVMGFITYETNVINDEPVYAFDTQFAYLYTNGGWDRLGTALWTGSDSQFYWGSTYRGLDASDRFLFVTNFNTADLIKYWNGANWTNFSPAVNASNIMVSARLIVPFHNHLVALNVIEYDGANNISYPNRMRYSQNGSPVAVDAWREDAVGKGSYNDAPTSEQIITCEFIKDRLIVYFERSTWELVWTGNTAFPFIWQQINSELGAESTFSVITFDKFILGIGDVGVHSCNGSNVDRIDDKIPQEVFNISNQNDGVYRVYGIRDYYNEMVYWTFPSLNPNNTYPNRVLVYNYIANTWSFNDDSITAFGYFQDQDNVEWQDDSNTWAESLEPWADAELRARTKQIVAGNQQGYIFLVDADNSRNAMGLQITNITGSNILTITSINHNLVNGDYIAIENANGYSALNLAQGYPITRLDDDSFTIIANGVTGTYLGGGTIARISRIDIVTKQYNFYLEEGRNAYISKVDFFVDKTVQGKFAVDSFVSSSSETLNEDGMANGSMVGLGILETSPYDLVPLEKTQARIWHPLYMQADGECIQLRIYLNDDQMSDILVAWEDFELSAMTFYAQRTASRLQ